MLTIPITEGIPSTANSNRFGSSLSGTFATGRVAQLERGREWDLAVSNLDRALRWAIATGQMNPHKAERLRYNSMAEIPRREVIAHGLPPQPPLVVGQAGKIDAMMADAATWEKRTGVVNGDR